MMQEMKPELRFEGFDDTWEQRKLGELATIVTGSTPPTADAENYGGSFPFVSPADISESRFVSSTQTTLSEKGFGLGRFVPAQASLFVCIGSSVGKVGQVREGVVTNQQINAVIPGIELTADFTYSLLEHCSPRVKAQAGTQAVPIVNKASFADTDVAIPSLGEQARIGSTLTQLDNLITLHQREYDKLLTTKQSLLQKMFPKAGETEPELRFDGFEGPWGSKKLGELVTKVTQKNRDMAVTETFTNSAEFGIVSQLDFFDHDVAREESIGGYFVVQPEDFVYNPRISSMAPVGPINRNRLGRAGVMSPLYTVFRPGDAIYNAYLEHFFEASGWHDYMQLNGNSGARSDRFSISDSVFFEMPIPYPSIAEQTEIANVLERLGNLISLRAQELEKLKQIKSGLLQRMFVCSSRRSAS